MGKGMVELISPHQTVGVCTHTSPFSLGERTEDAAIGLSVKASKERLVLLSGYTTNPQTQRTLHLMCENVLRSYYTHTMDLGESKRTTEGGMCTYKNFPPSPHLSGSGLRIHSAQFIPHYPCACLLCVHTPPSLPLAKRRGQQRFGSVAALYCIAPQHTSQSVPTYTV